MRIWVNALILLGLTIMPASAAEVIGKAASIINKVSGQLGNSNRRLRTRDNVHLQERIRARAGSTGQFKLHDGSKLVVGPNAVLNLDNFVYSGSSKKNITISAIRGAFRFISGKAKSSAYRIKTPVATIGVRGTVFDFYVGRRSTSVLLLRGAVQVCNKDQKCRILDRPCQAIRVTRNKTSPIYRNIARRAMRGVSMKVAFPFVGSQRSLLRPFRSRGLRACDSPKGSTRASLSSPPASVVSVNTTPDPPAPTNVGNPGNDKGVGNASETPNGGDFGSGVDGRGDVGNGGNGPGGNGPGGDGPGGNGHGRS